jgi:hypothetical protein
MIRPWLFIVHGCLREGEKCPNIYDREMEVDFLALVECSQKGQVNERRMIIVFCNQNIVEQRIYITIRKKCGIPIESGSG